jgi:hypothetical protein
MDSMCREMGSCGVAGLWSCPTAHRDNGTRFVVRADDKLTAFLELERVTRESLRFRNAE